MDELTKVFAEHHARVGRVLRRAGVPERDVPDAQQDVFIVVQRKLAMLESHASMSSWLHGIAVRVASQYRRRARVRHERMTEGERGDPLAAAIAHERCAVSAIDDAGLRAKIATALHALSAPQREVFVLREVHELSMLEIAAQLDLPLKTAFSRLYAARRALSDALHSEGSALLGDTRAACDPKRAAFAWLGIGVSWALTHASRIARAQLGVTPKLALVALSLACVWIAQPSTREAVPEPQTRAPIAHAAHARATIARLEPAVHALTTAQSGATAQPARVAKRTHARRTLESRPVEPAIAAVESTEAPQQPVPQLDYAVWREGSLDLRPSVASPLAVQGSSTRLAPRVRVRGPGDSITGVALAFAQVSQD